MKLSSITGEAQSRSTRLSMDAPAHGDANVREPAEHLGDLALAFRDEFKLGGVIAETDILTSLQLIAGQDTASDRWLTLFNSPLGEALRSRHRDLNTAMGFVLSQLPKKPS